MQKIFTLTLSSFTLFTFMGTEPTLAKSFTFSCPDVNFQSAECEGPANKQNCQFTAHQMVEGEDLKFSLQQTKPSRTLLPSTLKLQKNTNLRISDGTQVSCIYTGKPFEYKHLILTYTASTSLPPSWDCKVETKTLSCITKD